MKDAISQEVLSVPVEKFLWYLDAGAFPQDKWFMQWPLMTNGAGSSNILLAIILCHHLLNVITVQSGHWYAVYPSDNYATLNVKHAVQYLIDLIL